ncbi:hypothetical protein CEXT_120471 [Caerostris extrusa]|uniref:Uncharacterized protein n=1 Tax=Caerostris extrusa TaxID=172846 RepID=A0AAV4VT20_CAEEX|nr:hypothetical protein CEXT_120471 [Caerostris extrusa]
MIIIRCYQQLKEAHSTVKDYFILILQSTTQTYMATAFTYCEVKLSLYDSDSNLRIKRWKQRKDQPSATILQNHNIAEIRTQSDANLKKKKCRFNGGCQ